MLGRAREALGRAFATGVSTPITDAERDLLASAARAVTERGMAAPAVLLLESCRPTRVLAPGLLAFLEPLLHPILGADRLAALASLFERPEALDLLLAEIERLARIDA